MVEKWLFEQYEMRNIIFIFKISHVIFAKCYYSPSGQYLETGWVNRLSRPLNRFSPSENRLNRYKNRLNRFWPSRRESARSLRCQLRSLRCQFLQSVLSDCQNFRAVNTFFCALLLRSLTRNRLNRFSNRLNRFSVLWPTDFPLLFLPLSPLLFFSVSFPSRRRPLFLLFLLHTPLQKLTPLEELLEIRSFRRSPSSSSISLGFLDQISGSRYCPFTFPCTRSYAFLII